jgi:hypothetical protein
MSTEMLKRKINDLETHLNNPVILMFSEDTEVLDDDVDAITLALSGMSYNSASLILSGKGGHFGPAIEIAATIRQKFISRLDTYIPTSTSSSLVYLVLLSNNLHCCTVTPLSQCDLNFVKDGQQYSAKKELNNDNVVISRMAKNCWATSSSIVKHILEQEYSLYTKDKVSKEIVTRVMDIFMGKDTHEKPIRFAELEKLDLSVKQAPLEIKKQLTDIEVLATKLLKEKGARVLFGDAQTLCFIHSMDRVEN